MRLLQHTRRHPIPPRPYLGRFRRWLGRLLTRREACLIEALEYRRHNTPTGLRTLIISHDDKLHAILADYVRYLASAIYPKLPTALIMPRRSQARELAHAHMPKDASCTSGRVVDHIRGRDICVYLILDADRMSHVEDTNFQYQRRINAVVAGTVLPAPHCAVIVKVSGSGAIYLPVVGRDACLYPPPDIIQPSLYILTEVPPPRQCKQCGNIPKESPTSNNASRTASSHPPSTKRAATSAAKSENGDKNKPRTLTYCPRISPRQQKARDTDPKDLTDLKNFKVLTASQKKDHYVLSGNLCLSVKELQSLLFLCLTRKRPSRAAGPRAGPTMRTHRQGEKTAAPGAVSILFHKKKRTPSYNLLAEGVRFFIFLRLSLLPHQHL